ncbi:MAG: CHAP domain-containing protein [Bdellovibrionaceae bacterium]|nr:CHAP domain-containing protein [Pseudobdellovibrionaceae bacterium]
MEKFNTLLGVNAQASAYSNGSAQYVSTETHFINDIATGLKWQCVEYVRRWLCQTKNISFASVNYAYEIWEQVDHCYHLKTKTPQPFYNYNNASSTAPLVGDLLVYAKSFLQTGHVAVLVEVNLKKKWVRLAEQNYQNQMWPANYSRQVNVSVTKKNNQPIYSIEDEHLLGWKSLT